MLIPVYIIGFIFGGLVLFAVAQRIPNRNAKIWLKAIGVLAGPIFFLCVAVFSGWVRERTYEVEWLTGNSAAKYLDPGKESTRQDNRDVAVLRRFVGGKDCYEAFISQELADYLGGLPTHTVQVQYTVTYDLFQFRTYAIKRIGNLSYHPDGSSWMTGGINIGGACFPWFDKCVELGDTCLAFPDTFSSQRLSSQKEFATRTLSEFGSRAAASLVQVSTKGGTTSVVWHSLSRYPTILTERLTEGASE